MGADGEYVVVFDAVSYGSVKGDRHQYHRARKGDRLTVGTDGFTAAEAERLSGLGAIRLAGAEPEPDTEPETPPVETPQEGMEAPTEPEGELLDNAIDALMQHKSDELRQLADASGVDVPDDANKADVARLLAERNITYPE